MVEALLIVIVILLVVDIYVTIKPKGVDMDPIQRNMDQKLISVEKTLREEFTINREESVQTSDNVEDSHVSDFAKSKIKESNTESGKEENTIEQPNKVREDQQQVSRLAIKI